MSYHTAILEAVRGNEDFRRVLFTSERSQLVLMSVQPGEDIGLETHTLDQVLVFVCGSGRAVLDGEESPIRAGDVYVVPAGVEHNFTNTGGEPLKLYTVYAPPEHAPGTVHRTRADAVRAEQEEYAASRSDGFTIGSLRA